MRRADKALLITFAVMGWVVAAIVAVLAMMFYSQERTGSQLLQEAWERETECLDAWNANAEEVGYLRRQLLSVGFHPDEIHSPAYEAWLDSISDHEVSSPDTP